MTGPQPSKSSCTLSKIGLKILQFQKGMGRSFEFFGHYDAQIIFGGLYEVINWPGMVQILKHGILLLLCIMYQNIRMKPPAFPETWLKTLEIYHYRTDPPGLALVKQSS